MSFLVESKRRTCCGIFVYDDKSPWMHLKCRECPLLDGETRQIIGGYEVTAARTKWLIPSSKVQNYQQVFSVPKSHTELTNSLTQSQSLPLTRNHHNNLPTIQHRRNTHRQRHPRYLTNIIPKEPRVSQDGIISQSFDSSAGCEGGPGLVEGDVTVFADTA